MNLARLKTMAVRLVGSGGGLAKSTLLTAGILGGVLLVGEEAKAGFVGPDFFQCTFGFSGSGSDDCFTNYDPAGTGITIRDKKLTWAADPFGYEGTVPPPGWTPGAPTPSNVAGSVEFSYELSTNSYTVALDFVPPTPSGQFGGSFNNTDPNFDNGMTGVRMPRNAAGDIVDPGWTYMLEILGGKKFSTVSLDADVEPVSPNAFFDVVKDVVWSGGVAKLDINEGVPRPVLEFIGGRKVTTTLDWGSCTQCTIGDIENTYTQHVPGPLPLMGVGAAFGYSRRLRNRINKSLSTKA